MLHYIFLVCLLAFLLPTFTAIPGVPGYYYFFMGSIFASLIFNAASTIRNNFLIVFFILLFHVCYQNLNLYNEDSSRNLSDYIIPVVVSNVFFDFYIRRPNKFKAFIKIFLVALFITSFTTIIALQVYPDASRLLAGSLSADGKIEEARFYMMLGIGDYVFSIMWVFISLILLYILTNNEFKIFNKVFLLVILFFYILALIKAAYATPFLLFIIGILLMRFRENFSSLNKLLKISIISLVVYLLASNVLISSLYASAKALNSPNISPRLENIAMRLDGSLKETGFDVTSDNELSKENIYLGAYEMKVAMSFEAFLDNPLTGGVSEVGAHNFFIDILGLYGIIGFSLIIYVFYLMFTRSHKSIKTKEGKTFYRFVFIIFLVLGIVKTYILLPFFFLMFFVIPLFINLITLNFSNQRKLY